MKMVCKNFHSIISKKESFCACGGIKKEKNIISIVIILIVFLIVLMIFLSILLIPHDKRMYNLSPREVVKYLKKNNCNFDIKDYTHIYTTHYVYVSCKEDVAFQKIDDEITNKIMYCWKKTEINDEWADMLEEDKNEETAVRIQYKEYEKWLKKIGLTSSQIINALNYYDERKGGKLYE